MKSTIYHDELKAKVYDILGKGLKIDFDPFDVKKTKTKEMLRLLERLVSDVVFRENLLEAMVQEFYRICKGRGLDPNLKVLESMVYPTYQCCIHARAIAKTLEQEQTITR